MSPRNKVSKIGFSAHVMTCSTITGFVLILACTSQQASADDFPGIGSRSGWSEALPHYNVANKYMNRGLYEQAAQHYAEAIAFYDKDADFFINYGVALRKLENYTGAEEAFKKAISLRNNDWEAWSNLANANLKQNRLQETINCFEKALKFQPPPAEKEAMLKDIADIKKILSMQAPPPVPTKPSSIAKTLKVQKSSPKTNASGVRRSISSSTSSSSTSSSSMSPGSMNSKQSGASVSSDEAIEKKNLSAPPSKEELKKSGWDWVN